MSYMFSYCNNLKEIKGINNFKFSKVKDMSYMFYLCSKLEYLDISSYIKILSNADTSGLIYGCERLKMKYGNKIYSYEQLKSSITQF